MKCRTDTREKYTVVILTEVGHMDSLDDDGMG